MKCRTTALRYSSGSSGWAGRAEKHEIYAVAFGGHLFYPMDPLLR